MKRLLHTMFTAGLALSLTACERETPPPDKTAKAETKPKPTAAAKADPKADEPETLADDGPEDDPADPSADPAAADDAPEEDGGDLDGYDPRVAKAARIATQISEDPQRADEMLAAADLDREKLDALMYEIANDPDLTAQYRVARGI